jgi:uncharacterized membrane protein
VPGFQPLDGNGRATQTKPMKITAAIIGALAAILATAAAAEPLPVPKPTGPGGSYPHGYIASGWR